MVPNEKRGGHLARPSQRLRICLTRLQVQFDCFKLLLQKHIYNI